MHQARQLYRIRCLPSLGSLNTSRMQDKSTPCITLNCGNYPTANTNLYYAVEVGALSLSPGILSLK